MAVSNTPWMGTLILTNQNQAYQLSALLTNVGVNAPQFTRVAVCKFLTLQADPDGGGARFYVGNSSVSSTNYGAVIFATQVYPLYAHDANLIRLDQIYVLCDTAGLKMNVSFITQ